MIKVINPTFKLKENNVFEIRAKEYDNILTVVSQILEPVKDAGFEIIDLSLKDSYGTTNDLEPTLKKSLSIKLRRGESEVDMSCFIPKMIDKNHYYIAGKKKIPYFQLMDIPVITRGKATKIRTNITTLTIIEKDDCPHMYLNYMGKEVPIALLFFATYGYDVVRDMFDLDNIKVEETPETQYDKLMYDLKAYYDAGRLEIPEFVDEVGRIYSAYDDTKRGRHVVHSLGLILKIDVMTARFFESDHILNELPKILKNGKVNDVDFRNKRIRCLEYVIYAKLIKNVYDLCMISFESKKLKFGHNSKQIISACKVSEVVQFEFAINPIEELVKLSRITMVGENGFSRESVPYHLRDMDDSMFGRICPVDTPDRENCGILHPLVPNVDLDENLRFTDVQLKDQPISVGVSMTPFVEHDDQTRLQMAAGQMRQAINLVNFEEPYVQTGTECLYTDYSSFIHKAKKNGEVTYVDYRYIFVVYEDGDCDIFNIQDAKLHVENMDFFNVYVSVGDKFKKGDILAESNFCSDGKIVFGRNLLTAVMPYYGLNYEDAIVISDKLVKEKIFTSIHMKDLSFFVPADKILLSLSKDTYSPLPEPISNIRYLEPGKSEEYYQDKSHVFIPKGKPYAITKHVSANPLEFNTIFDEKFELLTKEDVLINKVMIYPNEYNTEINQYKNWVEHKLAMQREEERAIQEVIFKSLPKKQAVQYIRDHSLDVFTNGKKFKIKNEPVDGMYVHVQAIFLRNINEGDKIGNRHGNKGTISKIIPHNDMPQLPDGRHADIVINPLGTISRMNIGQIFELHLAMAVNDLRNICYKMIDENASQDELKDKILQFVSITDNTKDKWVTAQISEALKTIEIDKDFIDSFCTVQPPFETCNIDMIKEACKFTGTDLLYDIYDPQSKTKIMNPISVGYMYFFRMIHISECKIASRGIGTYNRKTMQPLGGRKNKGGQRCGEMETCCFISHGALDNLNEMLTIKSDSIDLKNKFMREKIGSEFVKDIKIASSKPESVRLLEAYLKVIGINSNLISEVEKEEITLEDLGDIID